MDLVKDREEAGEACATVELREKEERSRRSKRPRRSTMRCVKQRERETKGKMRVGTWGEAEGTIKFFLGL